MKAEELGEARIVKRAVVGKLEERDYCVVLGLYGSIILK
jgi:hypothetical protein